MRAHTYSIFTRDGQRHTVKAANLRKAIGSFGGKPGDIVAAIESECLPTATEETGPFMAVILKNPNQPNWPSRE